LVASPAASTRGKIHVADLDVREAADCAAHLLAHAAGRRAVARVRVEEQSRVPPLSSSCLHELDAVEIEHGLLDAREHGLRWPRRRAAAELDLSAT
jgi:hypothetical protein